MSGVVEEFDKTFAAVDSSFSSVSECVKLESERTFKFMGFLKCWTGFVDPAIVDKKSSLSNLLSVEFKYSEIIKSNDELKDRLAEAYDLLKTYDSSDGNAIAVKLWYLSAQKILQNHSEVSSE